MLGGVEKGKPREVGKRCEEVMAKQGPGEAEPQAPAGAGDLGPPPEHPRGVNTTAVAGAFPSGKAQMYLRS